MSTPSHADRHDGLSEPSAELPVDPVVKPPLPVVISFWILIFSSVVEAFFGVLTLVTWNGVIDNALRHVPVGTAPAELRSYVDTLLRINVVVHFVFVALYAVSAYLIRQGRNWARIALTVIVVVFGLLNVLTGSSLVTVVSVLIELAAVALLYTPTAKPYFPRRGRGSVAE